MNTVNIIIRHNRKHPAAIFVLLMSLIENKYVETSYHIWVLAEHDEEIVSPLLELQREKIRIDLLQKRNLLELSIDKAILLQWNTIVTDDLSSLYEINLEENAIGAVSNVPEHIYLIPESAEKYSDAVLLLDCRKYDIWKKIKKLSDKNIKELPISCNLAYDSLLINKKNYKVETLQSAIQTKNANLKELREKALVLRYEEPYSPENFFDHPYAEMWQKYLYDSGFDLSLLPDRCSSIETLGMPPQADKKMIPVSFFLKKEEFSIAVSLIQSLEEMLQPGRPLDIRILYRILSEAQKQTLLQMQSEKIRIVLYNMERAIEFDHDLLIQLPQIFSRYKKVVWLNVRVSGITNLEKIYDCDVANLYFRTANENLSSTAAMLINLEKWIQEDVSGHIRNSEKMGNDFTNSLSMVCKKAIGKFPDECGRCVITEGYIEEEREEEAVKDVIEKLTAAEMKNTDLSMEVENLRRQIDSLQQQNNILNQERGQFLYELLETRKSFTYKVGRFITFIPRHLRSRK